MSVRAPLKLAILISGRGSNMSAILRAALAGEIAVQPAIVIADRSGAAGLVSAQQLGVPTAAWPGETHSGPFEPMLVRTLEAVQPDVIALAGFMRILSPALVGRYLGRMVNIHPSLLPAYRGLHTHRRVLAASDTEHGASVHFVTPELDAGPVVLQAQVAVLPDDTETALAARVLATEHIIYPRVLGWLAEGRLSWRAGAPWLDGQRLAAPVVEDFRASIV
ncbi:MAG TPA: phosphoribosylglycinamide formyltransferase [Steroidobacteraceae bacterium]|jgi:phosphoribosylglycinamide formyltransferase-1|nr:phosphoribosylglycinamide formyltransferase [Steroidobacteraceae bacterium]